MHTELTLIDELVSGCYDSFGRFGLLTAYSMLYFAAATSYERRRLATHDEYRGLFLCADDADVAVSPGSGFGPAGEGFLRLALVENEERLRQAVRQIGRCLGNG